MGESPFSIRSHACMAIKAANRAIRLAAALRADDKSEHAYCATQLRAAAAELLNEAHIIENKVNGVNRPSPYETIALRNMRIRVLEDQLGWPALPGERSTQ